ncbi:hypothetical protein KSP40_PGU004555 [Platanthera guangdongensis]|uniref:Uncharacterized protein n=1 Tax=Platanthera guangdongensis TaxID=2320717 RepID=A0ABR2LVV1_9ASPA
MEGSFFLQESKLAAGRLSEKLSPSTSGEAAANSSTSIVEEPADVLPEILRHTIPIREIDDGSSLRTGEGGVIGGVYDKSLNWGTSDATSEGEESGGLRRDGCLRD